VEQQVESLPGQISRELKDRKVGEGTVDVANGRRKKRFVNATMKDSDLMTVLV
jgi:hypothetical protein